MPVLWFQLKCRLLLSFTPSYVCIQAMCVVRGATYILVRLLTVWRCACFHSQDLTVSDSASAYPAYHLLRKPPTHSSFKQKSVIISGWSVGDFLSQIVSLVLFKLISILLVLLFVSVNTIIVLYMCLHNGQHKYFVLSILNIKQSE